MNRPTFRPQVAQSASTTETILASASARIKEIDAARAAYVDLGEERATLQAILDAAAKASKLTTKPA